MGAGASSTSASPPPTTKILYFTNRSVTPFMSTINKRIGEIRLIDFKNLFDRPGFFRYHFKAVDQEFGMVKEEVSSGLLYFVPHFVMDGSIFCVRTMKKRTELIMSKCLLPLHPSKIRTSCMKKWYMAESSIFGISS